MITTKCDESTALAGTTSPTAATPAEEPRGPGCLVRRRRTKLHARRALRPGTRQLKTLIEFALVAVILASAAVTGLALERGSWTVTPVLSGSMRPGLPVGGVVIAQRVPAGSLAVRDVIVFRSPANPSEQVVHRIVRLDQAPSGPALIHTQGDANTVQDPWTVTIRGSYAYRVRWSVPMVGYAAVAFQNGRGLLASAAGVILIGVAASALYRARRRARACPTGRISLSGTGLDEPAEGPAI